MIFTKGTLAQQTLRRVHGGDVPTDSPLDPREVIRYICMILNKKVKQNYFENYKLGEPGIDGQYIGRFPNVAVSKDTATLEYYSIIPSSYVALPKGRGLRQVSSMRNQRDPFIIRTNGNKGIYSRLQAGSLQGRIGCYPEGNKIWYDANMDEKKVKEVLVKVVIAGPDTLGESDPLPIDASEAENVVREAVAFFAPQVPQDKINNNNPNM